MSLQMQRVQRSEVLALAEATAKESVVLVLFLLGPMQKNRWSESLMVLPLVVQDAEGAEKG